MAGSQAAWGIDVGVSSLKALKLRREGDRVTVEEFEVIEHDKFLTEPDVDRDALIRSTLQKFMKKYAVRRDAVFIGVPGSTAFARFVKLPPVETKKIPEIVRFEAVQQIPFPLDQVNWDYHTFQHPDSPDVEVGIFAMKKELVAHVMSNFRAVNLLVHGVQMSPLAVYNAAAYDGMTEDKGTVVIDMGAEHTDLVIMDQGRMWLRSINIGGNHFTDALAKSFKQQFAKAETLKKTAATSKYQKQIYQAMRPVFADLVSEIQRSLGAYNSTHRDGRLEHIVCMGNPFKLPNLQKYLQQELKMDVSRLENYRRANVEKAAKFSEDILSMSAAYGLAIQALGQAPVNTNLLPIEIARSMMWKKKEPWFVGAAALVAVGAGMFGWQWWSARSELHSADHQAAVEANNAELDKLNALKEKWNRIANSYKTEQDLVDKNFKLLAARQLWPAIYTDIMAALPQAAARPAATIVLTEVSSEYSNTLSNVKLRDDAGGAGGMAVAAAGPAPTGGTTGTQPATQPGSDRGFKVTITGYTRNGRQAVQTFLDSLLLKADDKAPEKNAEAYYFESSSALYSGDAARPLAGGGAGFSGLGGGAGGGTQAPYKPWGNAPKGPYWDAFYDDITGRSVPAGPTTPVMSSMAETELPYAVDLFETRKNLPTVTPTPIATATKSEVYWFNLRFRVFIKPDGK